MRKLRYSILVDKINNVYIPQYSRDSVCWYSFQNVELGYTLIYKTVEEAQRFLRDPSKVLSSILTP